MRGSESAKCFIPPSERRRWKMLPINKILCPTDFSQPSLRALDVAMELTGCFSAQLVLLHVVHPIAVVPSPAPAKFDVPGYQRAAEVHAIKKLEELASERTPDQTKITARVIIGIAAQGIAYTAMEESADLIVIATHGETGWKRFVFGSVAEKVVRIAEKPILVVPASPGEKSDNSVEA
jgi:nucleotide-binding universal stress UspA family protein